MRKLFGAVLIGAALLASGMLLSGCDHGKVDLAQVDTTLSSDTAQNTFAITCGTIQVVSGGWDTIVAANPGKISARAQYYVDLAQSLLLGPDGKTGICVAPYPTSLATLAPKAAQALANLYLAFTTQGIAPPTVTVTVTGSVVAAASSQ